MTRRDMMIIAVLLNAGLLVILFATSLKSNPEREESPSVDVLASHQPEEKAAVSIPATPAMMAQMPSSPDQVDQVIQQYVTPQIVTSSQSTTPAHADFLADLQDIERGVQTPTAPKEEASPEVPSHKAVPSHETVSYKEVKVKKGDVLERIARQNRVTVQEILSINHLTSTRLKIGQVLKIPATHGSTQENKPSLSDVQYYTVRAGDNPWTIAAKHHLKVEDLLSLNNLDEQTARRLKAGDKLRIK